MSEVISLRLIKQQEELVQQISEQFIQTFGDIENIQVFINESSDIVFANFVRNNLNISANAARYVCFTILGLSKRTKDMVDAGRLKKSKETCLQKYGCEFSFQSENNRQKSAETMRQKYGCNNIMQTEFMRQKRSIDYQSKTSEQKEQIRHKRKQTMMAQYGVEYYTQSEEMQQKAKSTKLERYGDENYNNYDAAKKTNLQKYGVEHILQGQDFRLKAEQTMLEKYGVAHPAQSLTFNCGRKNSYKYNNVYFDSFPELAVYLYCINNKIKISRADITFEYILNESKHVYKPDFIIDGKLIEIKGDHFFNEDGTMRNPFDSTQDALYEAKHQCGLSHNVEFWTSEKYSKYIDWFIDSGYNLTDFCID